MNHPESNGPGADFFRQEFARLVARPEEDLDLARAALLAAGRNSLTSTSRDASASWNAMPPRSRVASPVNLNSEAKARELGRFLFDVLGFKGNSANYYNTDNSYFNRVLENRPAYPLPCHCCLSKLGAGQESGYTGWACQATSWWG